VWFGYDVRWPLVLSERWEDQKWRTAETLSLPKKGKGKGKENKARVEHSLPRMPVLCGLNLTFRRYRKPTATLTVLSVLYCSLP
jgi:hypothetical protein